MGQGNLTRAGIHTALAKALARRDGLRVPTSSSAWVPTRIAAVDLSPTLTTELSALFAVFGPLTAQIAVADARIAAFMKEEPIAALLTTAPGVGPVTASAFVATTDDIRRFRAAYELVAYLGVVPCRSRSGAANGSRWSRSLADWRGSSTRGGVRRAPYSAAAAAVYQRAG